MAKKRIKIPDDVAAEVMFASDRTCCICKDSNRNVQIHHIDGDPSNNDPSNLAVLCTDHHSEVHSKLAFARNLSAETVVLYRDNWHATVRQQQGRNSEEVELVRYRREVLLQLSLIPHEWKNAYINLYPGGFKESGECVYVDVWDKMINTLEHVYSNEAWKRYLPLFEHYIPEFTRNVNTILSSHGDVIPTRMKTIVLRVTSALRGEKRAYLFLPQMMKNFPDADSSAFAMRFQASLEVLALLDRKAKAIVVKK